MYDLQKIKTGTSVLMRESKCMRVVHLLHYGQACALKIALWTWIILQSSVWIIPPVFSVTWSFRNHF